MLLRFIATAMIAALLALPAAADDVSSGSKAPKPPLEPRNGNFVRTIPLDVPAFRGLEPALRLTYDSGTGLRNMPFAGREFGIGWSLQGVSAIQRVSGTPAPAPGQNKLPSGRGAPAYGAAGFPTDSFMLDGTELVPCSEIAAPSSTPSCAVPVAGGQTAYSSRIETFARIRRNPAANSWEVTTRDGTTSSYTSLEGGMADTTFRWYLAAVRDRRGNHVDYGWTCNETFDCTIASIRYFNAGSSTPAGEILFYAETRPDPLSYGTGRDLRSVTQRITAIETRSVGQRRNAYKLTYELSASTQLSRLIAVQQFGSDAAITGNTVTGGTSLPPYVMSYSNNGDASGNPVFVKQDNWWRPASTLVGDFNGDGWSTDYLLPGVCEYAPYQYYEQRGHGESGWVSRDGYHCSPRQMVAATGQPTSAKLSLVFGSTHEGNVPPSENIIALADLDGDGRTDLIRREVDDFLTFFGQLGGGSGVTFSFLVGRAITGTQIFETDMPANADGYIGDFDGDGADELPTRRWHNHIKQPERCLRAFEKRTYDLIALSCKLHPPAWRFQC